MFVQEVARKLEPGEHAYAVAEKIADWILGSTKNNGWIVGLYGGRGSGKTSILYTILEILRHRGKSKLGDDPACILPAHGEHCDNEDPARLLFSPAATRDGDDLLFALLEHIQECYVRRHELNKYLGSAREAEVRRKDLGRFLQYAQETATSSTKIPEKLVDEHVAAAKTTDTLRRQLEEFFDRLTNKNKSTVLLVVDDVDLQPHRTLELLELLYLFLNRPGVVVLVAADRDLMLRSMAHGLEKRHLGQPGLAGALLGKYVPYGWNVPGPTEEQRFETLWDGKDLHGDPELPQFWTRADGTKDRELSAELLRSLLPPTYRGIKAVHNRLLSLRDDFTANGRWREQLFKTLILQVGLPKDRIEAALSLCVAVDAQRPELGALAALVEQPSLFRQVISRAAPDDPERPVASTWSTPEDRRTSAISGIGQELGRIPDFLQSQAQRPSGLLTLQAHDLPLLDRLGPPFLDGRALADATRLVNALGRGILEFIKESSEARPTDRFIAVSLNADAYRLAESLRLQRRFEAHQEIHIDLQRFAPSGRATPTELEEAHKEARAQIEAKGVRSFAGRIDLHAKAQLPLLIWLGWHLHDRRNIIAHNEQRRGEDTSLIEFIGPEERVLFKDRHTYEILAVIPQDFASEGRHAIVLIDLVRKTSPEDLNRFPPEIETPHRYRMLLREQRNTEPEHLAPILRDVIELLGQLRERGVQTFHLGFAGPDVVAFFLGQQLNASGRVRLYEYYQDRYEHAFDLAD